MGDGFQSRVLICTECLQEFAFTVEAQHYFAERGYTDDPKRCKFCHTQYKKSQRDQQEAGVSSSNSFSGNN